MAREPFRFTLEPKLVQRGAERDRIERQLAQLTRERNERRERVEGARKAIEETAQRIGAELDKQTDPDTAAGQLSADTWLARSRFVEELREYQARQRHELDVEDRQRLLAEHKLKAKEKELDELVAEIEALERAKAEQYKQYKTAQERLAEKRRDEDALLRWNHQRRHES